MSAEAAPRRIFFPLEPIPAKATLRRRATLPEYVLARMLNEFVYCPRLFFYEWVEGVFRHSSDTVDGAQRHESGDARHDALPPQEELTDLVFRARGVTLSSDTHKLIAKLDLIEAGDGKVTPVDYKRGCPRDGESGPEARPADVVQLCVQRSCSATTATWWTRAWSFTTRRASAFA